MKKIVIAICAALTTITITAQSKVYFTNDITPESLVKIYEALGVAPQQGQHVAVKISTTANHKQAIEQPGVYVIN